MKHKGHDDEHISICEDCGASVYKEHLDSGIARYEGGKLLCSHCVADYERAHDAAAGGATEQFAPIELDEEDDVPDTAADMSSSRIHTLSQSTLGLAHAAEQFKRALQPTNPAATRCRTFHCRLSEGSIEFMTNQVNEWVDNHDDVTIKFVSSTIGPFEGKHTEPNLILTLFY